MSCLNVFINSAVGVTKTFQGDALTMMTEK